MDTLNLKSTGEINFYLKSFDNIINNILNTNEIITWNRLATTNCYYSEPIKHDTSFIVLIKSYQTIVGYHDISYGEIQIRQYYSRSTTRQINRYINEYEYDIIKQVNINAHLLRGGN